MKKLIITCLACLFLFTLAQGQSALSKVYKPGTKLYVYAPTGLNLRDKADLSGKILTRALFNSKLTVLQAMSTAVFDVDGIPGTWVKVKHDSLGLEGYLFDGYLSRIVPDKGPFDGLEKMLSNFLTIKSTTDQRTNVIALGDIEDGPDSEYKRIDYHEGAIYERNRYSRDVITIMFPKGVITTQEMYLMCSVFFDNWKYWNPAPKYNEKSMKCVSNQETDTLEMKGGPLWWTIRYSHQGGD